ncbi:MAG: hypothetical protein DWH78_13915 [Planctomycetota bacterium]|nr:MAG: hypothetical protein DWH78_13915 [Planctomycetota bacterium]
MPFEILRTFPWPAMTRKKLPRRINSVCFCRSAFDPDFGQIQPNHTNWKTQPERQMFTIWLSSPHH